MSELGNGNDLMLPPKGRQRINTIACATVGVGVFALYAVTSPRGIVLEDDGEFVAAAHLLAVPHPPGYPLYVLLAHPFSWLPLPPAYAVHLASAVFGALTSMVVTWLARMLWDDLAAGILAGLALGVSRTFWSQSIIAEVYTLHALLFFLALAAVVRVNRSPKTNSLLPLLIGLSFANHWPLAALSLPGLVVALWPARRSVVPRLVRSPWPVLLLFLVGVAPYGWLAWRSASASHLTFYGAFDGWRDFWFMLSRQGYAALEASPTAGLEDKLRFAGFLGRELLAQLTPFGALVALVGVCGGRGTRGASLKPALLVVFTMTPLLLVLTLGFDYEYLLRAVIRVYPLVPYGVLALWFGGGIRHLRQTLAHRWPRAAGWISTTLGASTLVAALVVHLPENNRRSESFASDYGRTLLTSVEPDAVLFTHGDADSIVLAYLHIIEGVRPDVTIVNDEELGIGRAERLFDSRTTPPAERTRLIAEFVRDCTRPVYFISNPPSDFGFIDYGFYRQVVPGRKGIAGGIKTELVRLFDRVEFGVSTRDPWTKKHRQLLIARFSRLATLIVHRHPDSEFAATYRERLERACQHFLGILNRVRVIADRGGSTHEELLTWIAQASALQDETVTRREESILYLIQGRVLWRMGREQEARQAWDRSLKTYPHPRNAARELLKTPSRPRDPKEPDGDG